MSCNALLGRNSAISGFGGSGFIRDYSAAATIEVIDSTGIGSSGAAGWGNAPFRENLALFSGGTIRINALTSANNSTTPGNKIGVSSDGIFSGSALVVSSESAASYDNFVYVAVSAIPTAC